MTLHVIIQQLPIAERYYQLTNITPDIAFVTVEYPRIKFTMN
jgi:hypothetical protein